MTSPEPPAELSHPRQVVAAAAATNDGEVPAHAVLEFGEFALDSSNYLLRGPADRVQRLQPKTFDLLHHLLRNPGRVLDKDELLPAVWPGVIVTEHSLTRCIKEIRKALGDEAQNPRYIETVARRGYRFGVAVRVAAGQPAPDPDIEPALPGPLPAKQDGQLAGWKGWASWQRPPMWALITAMVALLVLLVAIHLTRTNPSGSLQDHAGIAVLRFDHDAEDESARVLAEGLSEDLIDLLAQVPGMQVAASRSSLAFAGGADPRQVGRALGVRWVLAVVSRVMV